MAKWTRAYMDKLPDSAFLAVMTGGKKDSEGKTVPRSKRKFPIRDANGKIDKPHLDNALARIPDSDISDSLKDRLTAKAEKLLEEYKKAHGMKKSLGDMSYNDLRQALQQYMQVTYGKKAKNDSYYTDYPYVNDIYETEFVVEYSGKHYMADYAVKANGEIEVGDFYDAKKVYNSTGKKADLKGKNTANGGVVAERG